MRAGEGETTPDWCHDDACHATVDAMTAIALMPSATATAERQVRQALSLGHFLATSSTAARRPERTVTTEATPTCPGFAEPNDDYRDTSTVPRTRRARRANLCLEHATPAAVHLARSGQPTGVERRVS